MRLRLPRGGSRFAACVCLLLLAGCASAPDAAPAGATTPATATSAPPTGIPATATPTPPAPFVGVRFHLVAPQETVRAGEEVVFRLILENRNGTTLWTEPTFACSGTWDVQLYDADGERVRIDDRDAMGCPSGGPLTDAVPSGEDAVAEYVWDGHARPQLGQQEMPPPGRYEVRASAAYGDAPEGPASQLRRASVTLVVTG